MPELKLILETGIEIIKKSFLQKLNVQVLIGPTENPIYLKVFQQAQVVWLIL